jgi:hypothetical protein
MRLSQGVFVKLASTSLSSDAEAIKDVVWINGQMGSTLPQNTQESDL